MRIIEKNISLFIVLIGALLVSVYMLPYFYLGSNALFNIGDNLDSNVPWYVVLSNSEFYWNISNDIFIKEILGGNVLRNHMPGSLQVTTLMFKLLPPLYAYVINKYL